jgi:DNA-binding transcriptional regulator YiaG
MVFCRKFVKNKKMGEKLIDKKILKTVLEDMLKERNADLQSFLEELVAKFLTRSADKATPLNMTEIRQKYALKKEAFAPLNDLFQDTPPAHELTKLLSK